MRRPLRLDSPGLTQHVVQCTGSGQPCFSDDLDYMRYLQDLRDIAWRQGCAVHAYVLMPNHAHLLVTPAASGGLDQLMQSLRRRYARHVRGRHAQGVTPWQFGYEACVVDNDGYLSCHRDIELHPVCAPVWAPRVADPADYRWSSHRHYASGEPDLLLTGHRAMLALGASRVERRRRYRELVLRGMGSSETAADRPDSRQPRVCESTRFGEGTETAPGVPARATPVRVVAHDRYNRARPPGKPGLMPA